MQKPYFDNKHYRHNSHWAPGELQPSGYFKGQADLYTDILECYYSYGHNASPKVMFKDPKNTGNYALKYHDI